MAINSLTQEQLSKLIHMIYSSAEQPALWHELLEMIRRSVGASRATLGVVGINGLHYGFASHVGWDPADIEFYDEHWTGRDPWSIGTSVVPSGEVVPSQALCPERDLDQSDCFNEFYRPLGIFQGMGGVMNIEANVKLFISAQYPKSSAPCSDEQLRLIRMLLPHMHQAVILQRKLHGRLLRETAMTEFIDRLPVGFVLLSLGGTVERANLEAERIFRDADGLSVKGGSLETWRSYDQQMIRSLVRSAVGTTDSGGASAGGAMTVARPSAKQPYQIVVTPVSPDGDLFETHNTGAVLLVTDSSTSPKPKVETLKALFGFTPAEGRIAIALMEGKDTHEIAADLTITRNTLRTHLKNLYSKAGARGQGDLVRLMMRSAASSYNEPDE